MRRRLAGLALGLLLVFAPLAASAVTPDEMLADPALEARARAISQGLRCLVCQNQSIEDSDADLAHDLRVLVRERVKAGDSDAAAQQYVVDRYGEFVLLQPVFALHTLILWLAAPAIVLVGVGALIVEARRRRNAVPVTLSAEEAEALESLNAGVAADPEK
jgi:cytochrome c-type biogenesis protein CcmH